MVGEQPGRIGPVARRLRVPDSVHQLAMPAEPLGDPSVQRRHLAGQRPAQLQPEQIPEQVVIAELRALGSSDTTNAFASPGSIRIRSDPVRPVSRSASSPLTRSSPGRERCSLLVIGTIASPWLESLRPRLGSCRVSGCHLVLVIVLQQGWPLGDVRLAFSCSGRPRAAASLVRAAPPRNDPEPGASRRCFGCGC